MCREAIHCDRLLEQQDRPSRVMGYVLSFHTISSDQCGRGDLQGDLQGVSKQGDLQGISKQGDLQGISRQGVRHVDGQVVGHSGQIGGHSGQVGGQSGIKFLSGLASVCGSCIAFDKYSFDNGVGGFYLGPIHIRQHADPLRRGVLCKPQGTAPGTPLYGVVVPTVGGHRGRFRFDSAVVAPELAFFLDALPRGVEYVHANRDKLFFPDGRGDLYAAACLLMRDAMPLVHECLPQEKRLPTHRPLNLEVAPVHFAVVFSAFCGSGDVFARFASALLNQSRSVDRRHLDMLRVHVPLQAPQLNVQSQVQSQVHLKVQVQAQVQTRPVLLTGECITSFAAVHQAEADERRATVARACFAKAQHAVNGTRAVNVQPKRSRVARPSNRGSADDGVVDNMDINSEVNSEFNSEGEGEDEGMYEGYNAASKCKDEWHLGSRCSADEEQETALSHGDNLDNADLIVNLIVDRKNTSGNENGENEKNNKAGNGDDSLLLRAESACEAWCNSVHDEESEASDLDL